MREDRRMTSSSRTFLASVVTVLASVAMLVTLLAQYANVLADSSSFSDRAVRLVHNGRVESLIVGSVSDSLLYRFGDQPSLQPVIREAVRVALVDPRITAEVRDAATSLQNQLGSGHANSLTLTLPDVGPAVASAIGSASPQLAAMVSRVGTITVVHVRIPPAAAGMIDGLATLGRDSTLLIALSAALACLALVLAPDRGRTLRWLGAGAVLSGLLAAAIYLGGRGLVVDQFSAPAAQTAARAIWSIYLGGLERSGLVLAGVGAAVAAVAVLTSSRRREGRQHIRR